VPDPDHPNGPGRFENAEENPHGVEFIAGCLIVKIPEPLTFANTGDLKNRLRRLELYGSTAAHPALPRVRNPDQNKNIIFDVHGVTSLDGSGAQVLTEIVEGYVESGTRVFFCRVPSNPRHQVMRLFARSGIVSKVGGMRHFVRSFDEALKLAAEPDEVAMFHDQEEPPV
jgi:MFS superfamily sulfate permease-like transporter